MIITKQILIELGADNESLSWLDQHSLYGLDHETFTNEVFNLSGRTDWQEWCKNKFASMQAMLLVPHEFLNVYRVTDKIFTDKISAELYAEQLNTEYNKQYDYLYSINARVIIENNDIANVPCDIYSDRCASARVYEAFDHNTNTYVDFLTYAEARAFALQKKQERETSIEPQFFVEQQVKEIGGTMIAWAKIT